MLAAIYTARARVPPAARIAESPAIAPTAVTGSPSRAATLLDMLDWHLAAHSDRIHILFYETAEQTLELSYASLAQGAQAVAVGLQAHGLKTGQTVAIMLPTSLEFFYSFFGTLLAGGVPVPMYPPARPSQLEDHLRRQAGILASCQAPILITIAEAKLFGRLMQAQVLSLKTIVTVADVWVRNAAPIRPELKSGDTALLQYTSGSTGNPKGVVLTHANLLANIRAWSTAIQVASTDVCVSWLPLYHDMGLIGTWLGSLYNACLMVLIPPFDFLARPERWLWTMHRHRGTISAAPNFAFELCLRKIEPQALQGLDLSSWRLAANGAEPVSPDTVLRFIERFAAYGFRAEAMVPVYGLAECAVGLAVPPLGRKPMIDHVQREPFARTGRALPAPPEDTHALRFVACGSALPQHQIRIVDNAKREVGERRVGGLEFRGPSATSGYFRNPDETHKLFDGDWLDTGDLAYIANGDVYITSRAKDMIIRGGHNIYPYELEEAIGDLPGIRKGCVAIFGARDPRAATERLVIVAETRLMDKSEREQLTGRIGSLALDLLGTPADDIVLAPPHTVLKTSSGKIRRRATRELYERGVLGGARRAVWWQVTRLTISAIAARVTRIHRHAAHLAYGLYAWMLVVLLAPGVWLAVVLAPRPAWGWAIVRGSARLFFRLLGVRLSIEGRENLSPSAVHVFAANHASYFDGAVLMAVFPRAVSFVAKREFKHRFWTRRFLLHIGAEFVERFDIRESVADTQRLAAVAKSGRSLFFFAEGTFRRVPGLMPFRMGAFSIAAEAGIPILPVTFRGTRAALPDKTWLPTRTPVLIHISPPIAAQGRDWQAALALRDAARREILHHCGEPDAV